MKFEKQHNPSKPGVLYTHLDDALEKAYQTVNILIPKARTARSDRKVAR